MKQVLLVTDAPVSPLEQALTDLGYEVKTESYPIAPAVEQFDLVACHLSAIDKSLLNGLCDAAADVCPLVVVSCEDDPTTIRHAVTEGVSAYVTEPVNFERLRPILDVAFARFEQLQGIRQELKKSQDSLAERKIIDKAKGILMQQKQMDEPSAYRAMQKMAMDRNTKLSELAASIITAADLLTVE
ncbi:MAG: ANTAR domain-containing protein [Pseudomonadota bacterium]